MSASIRVESGIAAGTNYWIDRPVLRIGSDPQCEICLPTADLAPHTLTLEFRDGNYRVYNRSPEAVSVGGALVQPGANGPWRADQIVHLPGDLRLVLAVDGDPRPSPRPESRLDDGFADDDRMAPTATADADAAAKKSSSTLLQLGVIGLCVLGMGAFLSMRGGGEASAVNRPTFELIVKETLAKEDNAAARALLPRLQYAQSAFVRGNNKLALARFSKLRDQLVRQNQSATEADRADVARMKDYVEYRLSQLQ